MELSVFLFFSYVWEITVIKELFIASDVVVVSIAETGVVGRLYVVIASTLLKTIPLTVRRFNRLCVFSRLIGSSNFIENCELVTPLIIPSKLLWEIIVLIQCLPDLCNFTRVLRSVSIVLLNFLI